MKIYNRLFRGKIGSIWICGLVTTDSHGLTVTIPECDLSGILGISGINIFNAIEWTIVNNLDTKRRKEKRLK